MSKDGRSAWPKGAAKPELLVATITKRKLAKPGAAKSQTATPTATKTSMLSR